MNYLKNKWIIATLLLLVLAGVGIAFRKQLGPWLGGYTKGERGYYYRFTQGKPFAKVQEQGMNIIFQFLITGPNGDTLVNKSKDAVEQVRDYPTEIKNEIDEIFQIAAPGSIVELLVPTDTFKMRYPDNAQALALPEGKNVKYTFRIIKILNAAAFEGYKNDRLFKRIEKENKMIDAYASQVKKDWKLDSDAWIKYAIENPGKAPRFEDGDELEFHTEVYTLSGKLVANSGAEGRKYKLTLGKIVYDLVAYDKVLHYLGEGEAGLFLVTSDYGYGAEGMGNYIAPYEPLLVKIKEVKKLNK